MSAGKADRVTRWGDLSEPGARRRTVRFQFRGLGPIRQADLELGELTVLAGRNNTGKTFVATALHGFFTRGTQVDAAVREMRENPALSATVRVFEEAVDRGTARHNVSVAQFHRERQLLLDAMSADFSSRVLDAVFGAPAGTFAGTVVRAELAPPSQRHEMRGFGLRDRSDFQIQQDDEGVSVERTRPWDRAENGASGDRKRDPLPAPPGQIVERLMESYALFALPELNVRVQAIPAEAAAVVLFQRELDRNKNRIVETLQHSSVGETPSAMEELLRERTSRCSALVRDFVNDAREMPVERWATKPILQKDIEKMIEARYASDGHTIEFASANGARDPFRVPLDLASTSARSLAGLYHAVFAAGPHYDLLIVDEPESSLDTRNQIRLARILARLVRGGVRVVVATHSDYLIKEFNNLVMLGQDFEGKPELVEELGYAPGDFLPEGEVCAYVAEDGGLTRCVVDRYGMNLPIFDETIDSINSAANLLADRVAQPR